MEIADYPLGAFGRASGLRAANRLYIAAFVPMNGARLCLSFQFSRSQKHVASEVFSAQGTSHPLTCCFNCETPRNV